LLIFIYINSVNMNINVQLLRAIYKSNKINKKRTVINVLL